MAQKITVQRIEQTIEQIRLRRQELLNGLNMTRDISGRIHELAFPAVNQGVEHVLNALEASEEAQRRGLAALDWYLEQAEWAIFQYRAAEENVTKISPLRGGIID